MFELNSGAFRDHAGRVQGVKAPSNYNADLAGLRAMTARTASVRPFLFADDSTSAAAYERAELVALDWGSKETISTFTYDAGSGRYLRSVAGAPHMSYESSEARVQGGEAEQLAFATVIVQRAPYALIDGIELLPYPALVGHGNADIFIGGRYIPGFWSRESMDSPTVYYDDQGQELRLTRGKTYIAHFPPESRLAYRAEP